MRKATLIAAIAATIAGGLATSATAGLQPIGGITAAPTPTHPGATPTAPVAGGAPGGLTAAASCAAGCIRSALVTTTASSATVVVTTSLPTSVVAIVEKGAELGLATGNTTTSPAHPSHPVLQTERTLTFPNLTPDSTYRITLSAKDGSGAVELRTGTFATRPVEVAVDTPALGLDSGAGCAAKCVTVFTATRSKHVPGRVAFKVRTTTAATIALEVSPSATTGHPYSFRRTVSGAKAFDVVADGMLPGSSYVVSLKVKDVNGRVQAFGKQFTTAKVDAIVTFHKVQVLADGDDVGAGEIALHYYAGAQGTGTGFRKIDAGTIVTPQARLRTAANGSGDLSLHVLGVECDGSRLAKCAAEVGQGGNGEYGGDLYVDARRTISLPDLYAGTWAHIPGYGVPMPFGHDKYVILETPAMDLRFRVFATIDFEVVG